MTGLKARGDRFFRRGVIWAGDLRRWASWHTGGARFFHRYGPTLAQAYRWCFIAGCNNSGTTLLQDLLVELEGVVTLPHEGQRYTRALRRASFRGHERVWTEKLTAVRMNAECDPARVARLLHDWHGALDAVPGSMVVEKSTTNAVRMRWLQAAFPGSRFVGLVRNGYAVTEGIKRKGHKSVERAARHWRAVNEIMLLDAEEIQEFLLLRYEDLVSGEAQALGRLAAFLGIQEEELTGAFARLGHRWGEISDRNAASIDALSSAERTRIEEIAGPTLRRFSYDQP